MSSDERESTPDGRLPGRWISWVVAIGLAVSGIVIAVGVFRNVDWMGPGDTLPLIAATTAALLAYIQSAMARRRDRREEQVRTERIESIERPLTLPSAAPTLITFAADQLYAAAERERLALGRGERRLTRLYQLGTLLVLLSGVVPFALVYLYMAIDPLQRAETLKALGADPAVLAEATQRDWHLLVAGVSFGLLFLAAARGILNSELRQREAYRAAAERETYYGDLSRALRIADKLADDPSEYPEKVRNFAVRRVIDRLLDGSPREGALAGAAAAGDAADGALIPEHAKTLVALFSRPSKD